MNREELAALAQRALQFVDSPDLKEALDLANPPTECLSPITRQLVINELCATPDLFGKLGPLEILGRIWPISTMRSEDLRFGSFREEIIQHVLNNPDWGAEYLLERLHLIDASESRFRAFLEEVCHPLVQSPSTQADLVQKLNPHLARDGFELLASEEMSGFPIFRVVRRSSSNLGTIKNLIFASTGPKPDIVLDDATTNTIRIVRNAEYCLVYDAPIGPGGLLWADLVEWWKERHPAEDLLEVEKHLYSRLRDSLASDPERLLFRYYFSTQRKVFGETLPALIPQVYLHYDPYTAAQRRDRIALVRQRMDFLMILPNRKRVVIEVDGAQHYSLNEKPDPGRYAAMVAEDRRIKLNGYDVFRFGGAELSAAQAESVVKAFFDELLRDRESR